MADDSDIHRISLKNIHQEDGAHELATSPDMKPYLKAVIQGTRSIAGTGSDPPVTPRKDVRLAGGIGAKMGPCRLRES